MHLRYTQSGHLFIGPEDDPRLIARAIVETNYNEEFCIATDFAPDFVTALMATGFLVMSMKLDADTAVNTAAGADDNAAKAGSPAYLLLPKLHLERSIIFFEDFHEPRSARRLIPRYELRTAMQPDTGDSGLFDTVMERCAAVHGEDWLTPPLQKSFRQIRADISIHAAGTGPLKQVRPAAFGLYREGKLAAGEFGIIAGRVYTSYSGYYDEDSAGTVQLILTGRFLQEAGFAFWDLGMPLEYKTRLGARSVDREEFLELFRFYL
jgi:Leu/Phe-tRNA-protein transferase